MKMKIFISKIKIKTKVLFFKVKDLDLITFLFDLVYKKNRTKEADLLISFEMTYERMFYDRKNNEVMIF